MALVYFALFAVFSFLGSEAAIFTLENKCRDTIWPGIQPGAGHPILMEGGLELGPGQSVNVTTPTGWSGRVWGRRWCTFDASGSGTCATGDCAGRLQCNGAGGEPPATLVEFTLDSPLDFYDVSLVDGFNMPLSITPFGSESEPGSSCRAVQCVSDVNRECPAELQVRSADVANNDGTKTDATRVVGCKSACAAFGDARFCCTGEFANPQSCQATEYSRVFKDACPSAYSYAFDDSSSIVTCQGPTYYRITFCS